MVNKGHENGKREREKGKREREIAKIKVSSKYQFVIPESVRILESILKGDEVSFIQNDLGEIVLRNKSKAEVQTLDTPEEESAHTLIDEAFHSTDSKVILAILEFSNEDRGVTLLRKYVQLSNLNMEILSSLKEENEQQFLLFNSKLENTILRNQRLEELPEAYLLPYHNINHDIEKNGAFSRDICLKLKNEVLGKAPLVITVQNNEFATAPNGNPADFVLKSFKHNHLQLEDFLILDFRDSEGVKKYSAIEGKIIR